MLIQMLSIIAEAMLHENKDFIATETVEWIDDPIANAGGSAYGTALHTPGKVFT